MHCPIRCLCDIKTNRVDSCTNLGDQITNALISSYEKVGLEAIFMRYFYFKNETVQNDQRLIQENFRNEHEVL